MGSTITTRTITTIITTIITAIITTIITITMMAPLAITLASAALSFTTRTLHPKAAQLASLTSTATSCTTILMTTITMTTTTMTTTTCHQWTHPCQQGTPTCLTTERMHRYLNYLPRFDRFLP